MIKRSLCTAAMALCALAAPSLAAATIINLDATSTTPVTVAFTAGYYDLDIIGKADGGLFDGWNPTGKTTCTGPATCVAREGWLEAFSTKAPYEPGPSATFLRVTPGSGPVAFFSTALGALAAYQSATLMDGADWTGFYVDPWPLRHVYVPTTTIDFFVPEAAADRADNLGGVSLRVLPSIPEPKSWAVMLLGLAGVGAALRRRPATAS